MNEAIAQESNSSGLAFLDHLEKRHDEVLSELEQLNNRIEQVLKSYQDSRNQLANQPRMSGSEVA